MEGNSIKNIKNLILSYIKKGTKPGSEETEKRIFTRGNILIFVFSYLTAISLWFAVNLNGVFNITVNMPLEIGAIPNNLALRNDLPETIEVNLTGTALPLIGIYNNPPAIAIDVDNKEVNLFDQVRQKLNSIQEVEVSKVNPILLSVDLEEKISKKVPLKLKWDINFKERYGLISFPKISPDSVVITGAISQVQKYKEWVISDSLKLKDIRDDISQTILLNNENPLIDISVNQISFAAEVSEFTENEISVYIRTRDLPRGQNITYNPSSITIRYDVPLKQFAELTGKIPYAVYVPYQKIRDDVSGFVTPDIELTATKYALKLRNFQPKAVAYFSVVDQ